jgi:hypothetical protein
MTREREWCLDKELPITQINQIADLYKKEISSLHEDADWSGTGDKYGEAFAKTKPETENLFDSDFYKKHVIKQFEILKLAEDNSGSNRVRLQTDFKNALSTEEAIYSGKPFENYTIKELEDLIISGVDIGTKPLEFFTNLTSLPCPTVLQEAAQTRYTLAVVEAEREKTNSAYRDATGYSLDDIEKAEADGVPIAPGLLDGKERGRLEQHADKRSTETRDGLFSDKAIYQEQCFLLSQIVKLVDFKHKNNSPRLPYVESKINTNITLPHGGPPPQIPINANSPILVQDQPFGFINRMTQVAHSREMFNLPTDKLSSLVPTVRLYKVETDKDSGKDVGFVEIKFDTNPAIKSYEGGKSALDLFEDGTKRGVGVGLKDFSVDFYGSDPFAAKKAIKAKLTIFATSFGDLIKNRIGNYKTISDEFKSSAPKATYKFADLALKTGKTPEDLRQNMTSIQKDNLDKLNFRLKAVLGWANPQNVNLTTEEISAINDSFLNINLTPTTHEFSFDEMGGVTFTINFLAYIEDYFNNTTFNIFSSPGIETNRIGRKLFYEFLNNQKCDDKTIEEIKERDAPLIQLEKSNSLSKVISGLSYQRKILFYNLGYDQINKYLRTGKIDEGVPEPQVDSENSTKSIRDAFKTILNNQDIDDDKVVRKLQVSLTSSSRDRNKLSFFYVSDLLDLIMQNIEESLKKLSEEIKSDKNKVLDYYTNSGVSSNISLTQETRKLLDEFLSNSDKSTSVNKEIEKLLRAKEQFKKLRVVLGPMEVKDPFDDSSTRFCCIGDIPVSLNYFTEFLTEKILSKEQAYYPITNFIKELVNDLIKNFINSDGCFSFNTKQRVRLNSTVITAFSRPENKTKNYDDLTYFIKPNRKTLGKGGYLNVSAFMKSRRAKLRPILQVAGPSRDPVQLMQPNREFNYYIFYAGRSYPVQLMTGNEQQDAQSGIFHYILGKDRGLVKNITLDRTDMTGLKELRFEQEGYDGLTQLREVYNANVDCFLNPHTYPGTYIYVDPRGFSPEAGINYTQFGIGGYYMITRAEHSIGVGKADTKITAKWVADSTGIEREEEKKPEVSDEEDKPKKCLIQKRRNSFGDRLFKELVIEDGWDALGATAPGWFVAKAVYNAIAPEEVETEASETE